MDLNLYLFRKKTDMKKIFKKSVVPLFLTLSMFSGCSEIFRTVPAFDDDKIPLSEEKSETENLSQSNEITSDTVYSELAEKINCYNNTVIFQGSVSTQDISDAVKRLQNRRPDIFWLNGYSITYDSYRTEISFNILNNYSPDELQAMYNEIQQKAENIISMIPQNSTEYDKILFIHDYIINNTEYDKNGAESKENGIWGNAYGCLIQKKAVCQGYAEAFTYLMNRLGIESGICVGDSVRGRHAWNYVKSDGNYYWIDVTWDDPENELYSVSQIRHSNFMIDDSMLMRTRTPDKKQFFLPVCSSLENNYFVRNGGYFTEYNIESIGNYMSRNEEKREVEMMFANETLYNTAVTSLFENEEIWKVSDYVWLDSEISYSQDDPMFVIKINF